MEAATVLCPRCEANRYTPYGTDVDITVEEVAPYPALSRMDNKTYICTPCGNDEAMRDFFGGNPIPPDEWPIKEQA